MQGKANVLMSTSKNSVSKCPADNINDSWTLKNAGGTGSVSCTPDY